MRVMESKCLMTNCNLYSKVDNAERLKKNPITIVQELAVPWKKYSDVQIQENTQKKHLKIKTKS